MLRVVGKSRIIDIADMRVGLQGFSQCLSIGKLAGDTHFHGADTAKEKPGILWIQTATEEKIVGIDFFHQFFGPGNAAGRNIAVTTEVFCHAVYDDIGTVIERTDSKWCRKCAVNDDKSPCFVGDTGNGIDIDDADQRIGNDFCIDETRIFLYGLFYGIGIGQVNISHLNTKFFYNTIK